MSSAGTESLRLLIVENEPLIVQIYRDMAEEAGWNIVGPATTLHQAKALVAAEACDFAILDIHLDEGVTSLPVATVLRQRQVPFVFATGLGFAGCVPGFEGVPVLLKPIRYLKLVETVNRHRQW